MTPDVRVEEKSRLLVGESNAVGVRGVGSVSTEEETENRANLISVRDNISNFYYIYKVGPSQLLLTIVVVALTSPSFIFNFL